MTKSILLVEDDQFLSMLLKNRLEKEGLEVVPAKNVDETLAALKKATPDLILMDIILPGKSGFEIMELVAGQPSAAKVPIIIISNLGQEADIAKGKELGAVEYFVKAQTPIDDLVRKIKGFLGNPS